MRNWIRRAFPCGSVGTDDNDSCRTSMSGDWKAINCWRKYSVHGTGKLCIFIGKNEYIRILASAASALLAMHSHFDVCARLSLYTWRRATYIFVLNKCVNTEMIDYTLQYKYSWYILVGGNAFFFLSFALLGCLLSGFRFSIWKSHE